MYLNLYASTILAQNDHRRRLAKAERERLLALLGPGPSRAASLPWFVATAVAAVVTRLGLA